MLSIHNLHKSFGALAATSDVSLELRPGEIHGVIGPNCAGKSTLIAQIAGTLQPDSGQVLFDGVDVTRESSSARAARGLGRSFQITSLWFDLTVLENVLLGAQRTQGSPLSYWRPALTEAGAVHRARAALAYVRIEDRANLPVKALSYGEQKQLELALVLAGEPRMLLLDEPLAGVGIQEAEALVRLIERIRADMGILLVEHDMGAMFRLADRISVLHQGRILCTGTVAEVQADEEVRRAYLGEDDEDGIA
jgi:branched-chain amino acid transport system ATP-binding protein